MKTIKFTPQNISIKKRFDVLVAGGGMAGVSAAICAARSGLQVGLIEYFGSLGGIPTTGLLSNLAGYKVGQEDVVGGIAIEYMERLKKIDGVNDLGGYFIVDPEKLKFVLQEMLHESGVTTYLYTQLIGVEKENGNIKYAIVASKSGIEALESSLFIDSTGDGDLAVCCGCSFEQGRASDGLTQSATLVFTIAGIEQDKIPEHNLTEIWRQQKRQVPTDHTCFFFLPRPVGAQGEMIVNMTHILNFDATRNTDLTRARFEGSRQALEVFDFFKNNSPGFEHAYISQTAAQIGIRETRRIIGEYILTEDDVLTNPEFDDEIVRCGWGIDVHTPDGIHRGIEKWLDKSYGIPYRCITPLDIDNLYVTGRAISATHRALSSARINATCIGTGEAAGYAAQFAITSGSVHKIDIGNLQSLLKANKVIISKSI